MFIVFPDTDHVAQYVSNLFIQRISQQPDVVLGLATGGTMEPIYAQWVKQAKAQNLDVSRVSSFNLDEYVGLSAQHPQSYAAYMQQHLFQHLAFDPSRIHIPNGLAKDVDADCQRYADSIRAHGGIALQLLGVGSNGHIGFNEPGTPFDSRCHVVELSERTRIDNSRFFGPNEIVPASAITMGMQDIMDAHEIILVATGSSKAATIAKYYEYEANPQVPFTVLKQHPKAHIVLDAAAATLVPSHACQFLESVPSVL